MNTPRFAWWQSGLINLDAPLPWATPLCYELAFDVEPWHGPEGLERARADLEREGLTPQSVEVTWSLVLLACQGTGCHIGKALRATVPWHQVPAALDAASSLTLSASD